MKPRAEGFTNEMFEVTLQENFGWFLVSTIYAKNYRINNSRATRFSSRRKRDATGNLLLRGTVNLLSF